MQPILAFLAASAAVGLWGHRSDAPIERRVILVLACLLAVALYARRFL
jgi:hypothetical protein